MKNITIQQVNDLKIDFEMYNSICHLQDITNGKNELD